VHASVSSFWDLGFFFSGEFISPLGSILNNEDDLQH